MSIYFQYPIITFQQCKFDGQRKLILRGKLNYKLVIVLIDSRKQISLRKCYNVLVISDVCCLSKFLTQCETVSR